jgi:hypothetical protein
VVHVVIVVHVLVTSISTTTVIMIPYEVYSLLMHHAMKARGDVEANHLLTLYTLVRINVSD